MAQLNANIPYKECFVRNKYTGLPGELTHGYLFGVKSLINRPLLFHFMTDFGAVLWQLPISAFTAKEEYDKLSENENTRLQLLQTWDCQSNNIAVTTFAFLQNSRVDVRCRDAKWRSGVYLFTIDDYCGDSNELNVGFANDQDSKCAHFIILDDGNFCAMPNNLLRWHNPDFVIPYDKINVPKIKLNLPLFNEQMSSEDIDRSYGNSPYYFYYQEVDENEQSEEEN
jgi:hypothetical protein